MSETAAVHPTGGADGATGVGAGAGNGGRGVLRNLWRGPLRVPRSRQSPRMIVIETVLLLLVSLGSSAIYSILSIIRALQSNVALNQQTSSLNNAQASQSWLDLIYQLVGVGLGVIPAIFAIYLLSREIRRPLRYLGLDRSRRIPDTVLACLLAAVIGLPGLALYVAARDLGFNTTVVAANLGNTWWALPVLVLSAIQNAALEEVVMVGYLYTRWSQAGWRLPVIIVTSAVIRGSYHLYQGFGGFLGNIVMGLILGTVYVRTRRVLPLVITHSILDTVAFVGYALLHTHVSWLS
ncbi:CPBP family intramembrane glutamic endopeptidase [Rudaeicoccus suwonensis]|uniref:Membrane protease YdiL (CAAX protease family) n=1 Tax=Rudaeicoccus suwonensis TaxID=657409 RepID=A0A561E4A1_9MICO|nr:CPBP family intramembrane glutamic endopeptidase [Rudaeicoccus suwonensis]TWE10443.1 membrane protease YdiL (CAAX protease family) [Rudaeicoccus suwonensis]